MGCVHGVGRNPDGPGTPSRSAYTVSNVDDSGKIRQRGVMEIVDSSLVLHRKQGKNGNPSIIWPLNTIRRYGYEDDTFCFEAGQSSPSGEGIYAFKCKYAKRMFDAVQETLKTDNGTSLPLNENNCETNSNKMNTDASNCDKDYSFRGPLESPTTKYNITYTKVEIGKPSSKSSRKMSKSYPTSTIELQEYTAIDFHRTMHLSQKMLKRNDNTSLRKTRHDCSISNHSA